MIGDAAAHYLEAAGARPAGASSATFAYVTTETLPIGLLTLIARDLHASLPIVGLLVTGYAVVVVLLSLPLTRLTRAVPHRVLMGWLLGIFVVATIGSALGASSPMLARPCRRTATALVAGAFILAALVVALSEPLLAKQTRPAPALPAERLLIAAGER